MRTPPPAARAENTRLSVIVQLVTAALLPPTTYAMPPPLLARLAWTVLLPIVKSPCTKIPPPELVTPLARLLLNVESVIVRLPWLNRPAPPVELVLPLILLVLTMALPCRKIPPPPLPPFAILPVKLLPTIVVVVFEVCTRTAPPSAADVLPWKVLSLMPSTEELMV